MTTLAGPISTAPSARRGTPLSVAARVQRVVLIGLAAGFLLVMVALPLAAVVREALSSGVSAFAAALQTEDAWSALRLTLLVTAIAVPINTVFGIAAAWCIAKFEWRGKTLVTTLIDVPFTVSPVIAGMAFLLLFGSRGWLGPWLQEHGVKIVFSWPAIALATMFVTVPFIARELIPLMQDQSRHEEEAALSLGASGWQTFFRITLPNIKWGLIYGATLCTARAMGEFGAVSVVSGHIRGQTETLPLLVESLYGEYRFSDAAAIASLLVAFTICTVLVRGVLQWTSRHRRAHAH